MLDIPIIDIHTHIGHLPGVVGDVYTAQDLVYICEHEGINFMLVSSASATTIEQHYATNEILTMVDTFGNKLGGMLWVNPHDATWIEDVSWAGSGDTISKRILLEARGLNSPLSVSSR